MQKTSRQPLNDFINILSSAAISAAHHPPEMDKDSAGKPVIWARINPGNSLPETTDVENDLLMGHCTFTSLDVADR